MFQKDWHAWIIAFRRLFIGNSDICGKQLVQWEIDGVEVYSWKHAVIEPGRLEGASHVRQSAVVDQRHRACGRLAAPQYRHVTVTWRSHEPLAAMSALVGRVSVATPFSQAAPRRWHRVPEVVQDVRVTALNHVVEGARQYFRSGRGLRQNLHRQRRTATSCIAEQTRTFRML